ncbi:MAG: hypothetical protein ACYTFV_06705 [Planctomycetota bacterium]|jgi:hypothetical protein
MQLHSAAALVGLAAFALPASAQGSFTNLGPSFSFPTAVSADGSIIAGDNQFEFFVWNETDGGTLIGGSPGGNGGAGDASLAWDASALTGTRLNPSNGLQEMQRYDIESGTWTTTGNLGASSGSSAGSGWGTSGDGQVSVGLGWISAGNAHGTSWSATTGLVDLGSTVANRSSRANACDYDGNVIVGWQDGVTGFRQGAIWVDGTQFKISLGGNQMGELGVVSGDGVWAGGKGVFANGGQAYIWSQDSGVINLGHLDPTYDGSTTGLSADGKRAVGFDRPFGPALFGRGFYWTQATGMVDLNNLAANLGINTQGVTMSLPLDISADGRTIVGAGLGPGGATGWRLVLPEQDCGFQGYGYGLGLANELVLTGDGPLTPGTTVELSVANAFGDNAVLALSTGQSEFPLLGSLTALLDLGGLIGIFPMTPTGGRALFAAPLPTSPSLAGAILYGQSFAAEPTQPGLVAASNGMRVTFCP